MDDGGKKEVLFFLKSCNTAVVGLNQLRLKQKVGRGGSGSLTYIIYCTSRWFTAASQGLLTPP